MRYFPLWMMVAVCGCGSEERRDSPPPSVNELVPADNRVSKRPELVPLPKDQAEIDRLILLGYTPHADHMHLPGVAACPLSKGNEAVM